MSGDTTVRRHFRRHGGWDLTINDADVVAHDVKARVYCAERSHAQQPHPFGIVLGVDANPLSLSATMSPASARALADALLSAAIEAEALAQAEAATDTVPA